MYQTRDGPFYVPETTHQKLRYRKPMFICCGTAGLIFAILGGIILGVGKQKLKHEEDYTYILVGSIILGLGIIVTILAIFLSCTWTKLASNEYDSRDRHITISCPYDTDVELDGYGDYSP